MARNPVFQFPDRAQISPDFTGPRVAAIHGFMGRVLMQKHLLRWLRESGHPDTTMYGYFHAHTAIADDLCEVAANGRKVVIVGYSQGGFQAMKVARELRRRNTQVALLVTIAAGGLGRAFPGRWGFDLRRVPGNVDRCLNFFSEGDLLGEDKIRQWNLARPVQAGQQIENHCFPKNEQLSHVRLVTCYPESRVHPSVRGVLLDRLRAELEPMYTP